MKRRIVVAVTGASGSIYAQRLLGKIAQLAKTDIELGVVMSSNAAEVWQTELGNTSFKDMGLQFYDKNDFSAPFASGSAQYDTMVIIPCSMGTLGRIAAGISNDLITRAADVILKERRKLICVVRETPYNLIHIKNMETVTLAGGTICPATPSFYHQPKTLEEIADTVVDRVLDLMGIKHDTKRWNQD
jgi:flavin prenyltransferase